MRIALVLAAALAASACGASIGDPAVGAGGGGVAGGGGDSSGGGGGGGGGGNGFGDVDAGNGNAIAPDAAAPAGGTTTPAVASAEDYAHGLFGQICTEAFSCRSDYQPVDGYTFEQYWGTSVDNCVDGFDSDYGVGHINSDVTAGKVTFSASDASACLAAITFPSCTDFFNGNYSYPTVCDTAVVGQVADGGACNCGFECSDTNAGCPIDGGTCTAQQ